MRGSIRSRDDNTHQIRLSLGIDQATGKRLYYHETVTGSKKSAETRMRELLRDLDRGSWVDPSRMTLEQFLAQWLKSKQSITERTRLDYQSALDRWVVPRIGSIQVQKLSPLHVQKLYADLKDDGLGVRSRQLVHSILASALGQAVRWRLIHADPTDAVERPRGVVTGKKQPIRPFTAEGTRSFLTAAADDPYFPYFMIMIFGGFRPGEGLGLCWPEVDWSAGAIRITQSLVWLEKRPYGWPADKPLWSLEEPKTPKSRRTVELPSEVMAALRVHRTRQLEKRLAAGPRWQTDVPDLVFRSATGGPVNEKNLGRRNFKSILKAAGLPSTHRVYDLRHTCATLLLLKGEHPKVVAERLGHASTTLTMDTYSSVLPGMQRAASDKLASLLL